MAVQQVASRSTVQENVTFTVITVTLLWRSTVQEDVYYSAADIPIILRLRRHTVSTIIDDVVRRDTWELFVIINNSSLRATFATRAGTRLPRVNTVQL